MAPPDREITEEEWIAASQACCGSDPEVEESGGDGHAGDVPDRFVTGSGGRSENAGHKCDGERGRVSGPMLT